MFICFIFFNDKYKFQATNILIRKILKTNKKYAGFSRLVLNFEYEVKSVRTKLIF